MKLLLCILLVMVMFFSLRCAQTVQTIEDANLYRDAGMTRYTLPLIPQWMNVSAEGNCARTEETTYLDFASLSKSFSLSYADLVNFQEIYNEEVKASKEKLSRPLDLKEEEMLFFKTLSKVQNNQSFLRLPDYPRLNLVWIDPAISDKKAKDRLLSLMNSSHMKEGVPIFVSLCLSLKEIESYVQKLKLDSFGIKGISYSSLSIFDKEMKKRNHLAIDFSSYLKNQYKRPNGQKAKDYTLYFYTLGAKRPLSFEGKFK